MNKRPIIVIAIGWASGIIAVGSSSIIYGLLGGGAALLLAAAVLMKRMTLGLAACCMLVYAAGGGWAYWAELRADTSMTDLREAVNGTYPPPTYEAEAEGTIGSAPEIDGDAVSFRLQATTIRLPHEPEVRVNRERLLVRLKLLTEEEKRAAERWRRGNHVRIAGELERPAGASNLGGFDYRQYLSNVHHIHWILRVQGVGSVTAEQRELYTANALLGRIDAVRDWLDSRMERLYPEEQAGYMKGLVLGSSSELNPEVYQQFAELGLTHILAISGLHVAVFLYVLHAGLRVFRLSRERTLLLLALATPAYVLLSGASPSVVRAGAMAIIGLLAARYNRLKDGLHLLAAAAILMLVWNPAYVHDIGFQLSFVVTAGLILGVAPVRSVMPEWNRVKPLLDLAAVTIVAQLVSFPITIYYFNQWNPLSIPSNYVLVPFISFIVMPLGAASLLVEPVWPAAGHWLAYAAMLLNEVTFWLVHAASSLSGWQTIWRQPPQWWVAAWYLALAAGAVVLRAIGGQKQARAAVAGGIQGSDASHTVPLDEGLRPLTAAARRKHIRMLICAASAAAILLAFAWMPEAFDRRAVVSVLDVGQGDAILIRTGSGKHILIDGGGTVSFRKPEEEWRGRADPFEVGRKVLVPLLKQRGIHSLDLVIATHLDTDHIGGLRAVIDSVPVKRIWWNGTVNGSESALEMLDNVLERDVPIYAAKTGMSWSPDESTRLDVLWPKQAEGIAEVNDQNERSVSVLLTVYGRTFLFPGDIGQRTEQQLTEGFNSDCYRRDDQADGEARSVTAAEGGNMPCLDVLKAGHHGSKGSTSTQWLSYWKPSFTVISAGKDNVYRHPHPDTLARLLYSGSGVFRTDRDGEIRFMVKPSGKMLAGWQVHKWKL